jgi:hypothetical protein
MATNVRNAGMGEIATIRRIGSTVVASSGGSVMIPGFWKWRLTHMNLHRNACALEATHGEGKESFEAAMDLSLKAADEGDQRRSWFWWKVANELIRIRQRRALAAEIVSGMRKGQAANVAAETAPGQRAPARIAPRRIGTAATEVRGFARTERRPSNSLRKTTV